jgi:hypothetical protein
MGVIEKKGADLERNSNKGLPSDTSLGVNQNGKKVGTPRQFFEECENTGVEFAGGWNVGRLSVPGNPARWTAALEHRRSKG